MIATHSAKMKPAATGSGRKLLFGRASKPIPADALLVLVKEGDDYALVAVTGDANAPHDPSTLGSFLSPDVVDEIEKTHALALAVESTQTKPKTTKRRKAAKR